MRTRLVLLSAIPLLLLVSPASALTKEQKMETCKFGADNQNLTGVKRKTFIAKCMSSKNDPRGQPAPAGGGGSGTPQHGSYQ